MTSWRTPPRAEDKLASGKRRHRRYLLNAPITAVLSDPTSASRSRSRTLDVSESGVAGLFHESWERGVRLNLEIGVPIGRTLLKLAAIVRYRIGVRYGFEFVDVLPRESAALRELCQFLAIALPNNQTRLESLY